MSVIHHVVSLSSFCIDILLVFQLLVGNGRSTTTEFKKMRPPWTARKQGLRLAVKLLETPQGVSCFNMMGKSRALGALVAFSVGVFPAKLSFQ